MIGDGHGGRGRDHAPVAIEREKGERTKDMEMSFDASTRQVNL
jgi:hypothetical protein